MKQLKNGDKQIVWPKQLKYDKERRKKPKYEDEKNWIETEAIKIYFDGKN